MLEKICNLVFAEKKLKKIYKISKISFFCGIILIIAFPLLSKSIKIEEKHLKNTSLFSRNIGMANFNSYIKSYFYQKNSNDKILNFCQQIFYNSTNKPYNYIFSKDIVCPRCKKLQLIQINLIYDQTLKNLEIMKKSNFIFYALIRYLSEEKHITWLSKDLQFNYVTKELFDNNPKECYELLTKGKYNKKLEDGKIIHAIYNFDLTQIDIEHFYQILVKIVGVNSELVDIDFYRMVLANFQANFKDNDLLVTTNDAVLSKEMAKNIFNVLDFFGDLTKSFIPKRDYKLRYMYLIENIINNFFMINNKINTNHFLVTNGYNSLLFKTTGKTKPQSNERQMNICYKFVATILLMIKGMSNEEVDLFRGLYFYLLTSPFQCINYFYLFVLILMFVREFFNLIDLIYHNEYRFIWTIKNPFDIIDKKENEKNNDENKDNKDKYIYAGRIVSTLFFIGIIYILFMLNFDLFIKVIHEQRLDFGYYYMIGIIFVSQFCTLFLLNLTKPEERFLDIIIMYLFVLNCWNFVFVNIGIGIVMSAIFMPMEFIFLHLKQVKKNLFKIGLISLILYCILGWKELIITMTSNYITFNNNIYTFITICVILLTLRMALFIVMILNKLKKKEPWDYEEVIDVEEVEEEKDKKEDADKKEEKKEKDKDENEESEESEENEENDENNIKNENDVDKVKDIDNENKGNKKEKVD